MDAPALFSIWKHTNGIEYEVILYANMLKPGKPKYPETIIYRDTQNGNVFCRPLSDWHRSFTPA